MINLKDYAKKQGISYEAIRKQVARYRDELGDHISYQGKTQYLDEIAEEFLDGKRAVNAIHIIEHDKDEQIEDLKHQNELLKMKIMELQEQLIASKDQLLDANEQLIEMQNQVLLLTTQKTVQDEQPVQPTKKWWEFWK